MKNRPNRTLRASNPGWIARIFWKLRTNSPAPTRATVASATSATTRTLRVRREAAPAVSLRLPSFRTSFRLERKRNSAGEAPEIKAAATQARAVNARMRPFSACDAVIGSPTLGTTVDPHRLSYDCRVGVKIAAPQPRADHRHRVSSQAVSSLFMREDPTQQGFHPQHFEVIAGSQFAPRQLRPRRIAQRESALPAQHQPGDPLQPVAVIPVIQPGHGRAAIGSVRRDHLHRGQFPAPRRAGIRMQQHRIDPRKYRGRARDPQSQGQHADGGKRGDALKHSKSDSEVSQEAPHTIRYRQTSVQPSNY